MKRYIIVFLVLLLSCSSDNSVFAEEGLETRDVVTGLDTPWEILWGPDGNIWMTERYGRISKVNPETGELTELLTLDEVFEDGERGLMGMVLHPDFANNPYVFIVYTYSDNGNTLIRTVRYTYNSNSLTDPEIIIDNIQGAWNHDGSRLWIDDDHKLYMTTGDAANSSLSQDTSNLNGNLLRMNLDGSIPDDNPFPNSYIYSYGLRNSQGLVFAKGRIYSSDHGPSSDDEVNILEPGRNYGWPQVKGFCDEDSEMNFCETYNVREPIAAWTPTLAVAGLNYYDKELMPEFSNSLLLTTLKASRLVQLKLNEQGDEVTEEKQYYVNVYGRLRDICISPDGRIFIATSNKDGRGNPAEQDDRIIEIKPVSSSVNDGSELFNIFPVPSNNLINFEFDDISLNNSRISIFDNSGKFINSEVINSDNISFNIKDSGIYYAVLRIDNKIYNKKFIITK